ncbi:MAG: M67 family metallopeptidase [Nitrosopumilus sp.]|uniref:M67 family metallopeptidase n=1 Tax=Nitrosopumilus sp. TaxID=2024843 RepID=UPI00247EE90E|nr:M67 family metallopeptidase [Nitrosopumilus sp.]MCV0392621.1 M67 family metallopeptidase [Nitrosopumilus sp.]
MKKITITDSQKQILLEHAEKEKPNESCAILFGSENDENSTVKEIFLTKNIEESPVNFTISNEQLIEGYNLAEQKNMDVVAIFHSHPNSIAYPSETDKKFMHGNPVVWIIYSGITMEFKAFVLDEHIQEIQIQA